MVHCVHPTIKTAKITIVQSNMTTGRIAAAHMDRSMVFAMWHQCAAHLIHDLLHPTEPTTQTVCRLAQPFLHSSLQCPYTLHWASPSPKIVLSRGGSGPHTSIWYVVPWPTGVLNPNGISIGWTVFAGLTTVTDRRPTDKSRYSVFNNRPHLLRCGQYCDAA